MYITYHTKVLLLVALLATVGGILYVISTHLPGHDHTDPHPVGFADNDEEVHVHSDWVLHIAGTTYDLTDDKYQSGNSQVRHEHIHLHDNNDDVIHRHDHGVTLQDFISSLGFTLASTCITTDEGEEFCNTDTSELMVFVNDERLTDFVDYINQEEDRILVYFGETSASDTITELLASISDKACIYSGTCPERGTPPPESCGITCDI